MAINETSVKSFPDLLDKVEKYQGKTNNSWYRGVRCADHKLIPSLYRHPEGIDIEGVLNLETRISTRFVQRSIPYMSRRLEGEWDQIFFMQHYGVPTRLLDWTENPLIACYFALEESEKYEDSDAILWMCDPEAWNRSALKHISFDRGILDEADTVVKNHKPGTDLEEMPENPIMMYGSFNSTRIVAQRGVFCLFGKSMKSMEEIYEDEGFERSCMKKLRIPKEKVPEFRDSLFRKGVTESVVFPEIIGLAREIKRSYGYK